MLTNGCLAFYSLNGASWTKTGNNFTENIVHIFNLS